MSELNGTTKMQAVTLASDTAGEILRHVYSALQEKGYDPVAQLTGFILTGEPTYITSHNAARSLICRVERDEILEELVRFYLENRLDG